MSSLAPINQVYQQYLNALNFRPDDIVCVSFGNPPVWKDYFQEFNTLSTPHSIQRLTARNESGENAYISMAPFAPATTNRKKEYVAAVRHAWVDADENGAAILEQITADVRAGILPEPLIVIETSPGKVQVIWGLVADEFDTARQELLNRSLQTRYKTDEAVVDTARVLRIAGFKNNKYEHKPFARILQTGTKAEHRFSDFKIDPPTTVAKAPVSVTGDMIPHGSHDKELTRIAGKLRHDGMRKKA